MHWGKQGDFHAGEGGGMGWVLPMIKPWGRGWPMMAFMGRPRLIGLPFLSFSAFAVIFFKPMCNKTVIRFGFCSILGAVIRVGKNGDENFPEQTREPLGLLLSLVTSHGKIIFIPACCSVMLLRNNLELDHNPAKSGISVDLQKLSALSHFGSQVRRLKWARTFIYVKATEKHCGRICLCNRLLFYSTKCKLSCISLYLWYIVILSPRKWLTLSDYGTEILTLWVSLLLPLSPQVNSPEMPLLLIFTWRH